MDTSVENSSITRSDSPLRVINSSPEAVLKAKKRASLSFRQIRTETVFNKTLMIMGLIMIVIVLGILLTLIVQSLPSIKALGPGYLWGKVWNPVEDVYGAWPFLLGTLLTSFLALAISIPFSISVAIFLGEYYPQGWLPNLLKDTVELIAAVPSVIYGFWGLAVLVPIVRNLESHIGVAPHSSWPS
jgi:phosphate transport system permease protein